jgi:hypothetical protein
VCGGCAIVGIVVVAGAVVCVIVFVCIVTGLFVCVSVVDIGSVGLIDLTIGGDVDFVVSVCVSEINFVVSGVGAGGVIGGFGGDVGVGDLYGVGEGVGRVYRLIRVVVVNLSFIVCIVNIGVAAAAVAMFVIVVVVRVGGVAVAIGVGAVEVDVVCIRIRALGLHVVVL